MEPGSLTWVGSPCGLHGPYVFYKAFRFNLDGEKRLLSLGDFFFVRCQPGEPLCIAELQLLWEERTSHQLLSSSKLYFLPEDTQQGRSASHGEDEVMAVSQKVVVRLDDLVKWTVWDQHAWNRGMKALPLNISPIKPNRSRTDFFLRYHDSTLNCGLHFKDVLKEKAALGEGLSQKQVLVLSYPRYCRYRSVVARLHGQPRSLLTNQVVLALGGIAVQSENTYILYCRDTFHHPTLLQNESICDQFAPNLKGRPRKKKLTNSLYRDSQGQSQGFEVKGHCQTRLSSKETEATAGETMKNHIRVTTDKEGLSKPKDSSNGSNRINHSSQTTTLALSEERRGRGQGVQYRAEEQAFLVSLYTFMKDRKTPIERIPYLGFKQINLWTMFQAAQKLGGYELITACRQWKSIYDELGGNPGSTSAATCTRRHYERLLLPYERFIRGVEDIPLHRFKSRKQEELMEQNSQLKPEPQTHLDPVQPSHSIRRRPTQDCQSDTEIQLIMQHKYEVKRKRRYSGCDTSCLTISKTNNNKSVLPLTTPKIFNHAHSAVDLWQHQQIPLQDQCHVGKPRNLQSPTIPETPSEQAELPRTEDTSSGFTTLFYSPGGSKEITSPLAKKKFLLQVNSAGLPNQDQCHSDFGQPPPFISSSLTSCIMGKAAERPTEAVGSSVTLLNRPSVIQHIQSFKARVEEDRGRKINKSTPPPLSSHERQFHLVPSSHSQGAILSRDPDGSVGLLQYSIPTDQDKSSNPRITTSDDQPTDLSLSKSSLKPLHHPYASCLLNCSTGYQESTPVLSQNGPTVVNTEHYYRTRQELPLTVSPGNTQCNARQDAAFQTRGTDEAANGTVHNGGVIKKQKVGDAGGRERSETAVYNRMSEALGSQVVLHDTCTAQPLNKLGNSISKRRRQAITPTPKDVFSSSPRKIETLKELDDSFVGEGAEGAEGGAAASPFSFLDLTSPQIYPNILNPSGSLALSQVPNLCRDTLNIPLTMDQLNSSDSHLQNPLQFLKSQSADFVSPLVPPIATHSSIIQRQLLVQASASPVRIYQQTYEDEIRHGLYSVSVGPQPTFSQPQLNSVHPSTKLP